MALEDGFVPYAERDGQQYTAGEYLGLFVMLKREADSPGTMDGWAFGTVDPDGKVTSAGAVASCIACHRSAPHGGLFGWPAP